MIVNKVRAVVGWRAGGERERYADADRIAGRRRCRIDLGLPLIP